MSVRMAALPLALAITACTPTALYETEHGTVNLPCLGEPGSDPTVVFTSAAGDAGHEQWWRIQDALAQPAHSCIFDPPGTGRAPASAAPLTPTHTAEALVDALDQAGAPGPWVFVSHSHSALFVRVLGKSYPDDVHAAVFVNPMVPAFIPDQPEDLVAAGFDAQQTADEAAAVMSWTSEAPMYVSSHDADLAVSVYGWTEQAQDVWTAGQGEYASLTGVGVQAEIPGTENYLHREAPDVVLYTLEAARVFPEEPPPFR